jgi:hypothetical protein
LLVPIINEVVGIRLFMPNVDAHIGKLVVQF